MWVSSMWVTSCLWLVVGFSSISEAANISAVLVNPEGTMTQTNGRVEDRSSINQALFLSISENNMSEVSALLSSGADPNILFEDGNTALTLACEKNLTAIAKLLLSFGADTKRTNKIGNSPLLWASWNGNTDIVQSLIAAGAHVDMTGEYGDTALMLATRQNHISIVRALIEAQADANIQDKSGFTALIIACNYGYSEVVTLLLEAHADVNIAENGKWAPLMVASREGHAAIAEMLVEAGAQPDNENKNGWTALMLASREGHDAIAKMLVEAGAQLNNEDKDGWTALMMASRYGHAAIAEMLVEAGAHLNNENKNGWTALMLASREGHDAIAKMLVEAGAQLNNEHKDGWTALMMASREGHAAITEILVEAGAHLNNENKDGWTALMMASRYGQAAIAEILVEAGAHLNNENKDGWTALMMASRYGQAAIANMLVEAGAQLNNENKDVLTALMFASYNGHATIIVTWLIIGMSMLWKVASHFINSDRSVQSLPDIDDDRSHGLQRDEKTYNLIPLELLRLKQHALRTSSSSRVYRGTYRNVDIVLKLIYHQQTSASTTSQQSELNILSNLRHPRILMLLGVVQNLRPRFDAKLGLVTEYMPRGSLYDVLHSNDTPAEHRLTTLSSKLRVLKDVADGMRFLHDCNVIHKDLKSPNVLLDEEGRAKICDFGLSRVMSVDTTHTSTLGGGSVRWRAPEAIVEPDNVYITLSFDTYSFGVIIWEVVTGCIPWDGFDGDQICVKLSRGEGLVIPPESVACPDYVGTLMEECLQRHFDRRPKFNYIQEMLEASFKYVTRESSRVPHFHEFLCPISHEIMRKPVVCSDGYTYEMEYIEKWLQENGTSPRTNMVLEDKTLRPNTCMKILIKHYYETLNDA